MAKHMDTGENGRCLNCYIIKETFRFSVLFERRYAFWEKYFFSSKCDEKYGKCTKVYESVLKTLNWVLCPLQLARLIFLFSLTENMEVLQTWKEEMRCVYSGMARLPEEIDF